MTLNQLLRMCMESPLRRVKLWLLDGELKAYYHARENIIQRVKEGNRDLAAIDREICQLESKRRYL